MTAHRRSGIFIGHLNVKIDILAGVLVLLHHLAENAGVIVEGCGTRTTPTGGFVTLAGLAQNGDFRLILLKVGFKVDSLHEIVTVIPNGYKAFGQRSGNCVLGLHYSCHILLHPFLTGHRQSYKAGP